MTARTWGPDGNGIPLSAANLNALEADVTSALGVPDAALAGRINDTTTQAYGALSAAFANNAAPARNVVPANFGKWRKALGGVRQGNASAKLLCVGDSTTWGLLSNAGVSETLYSYPQRLASLLNGYHAPASVTMAVPPSYFSVESVDTRWVYGTSCIRGGLGFGNGSSLNMPVGAGNSTFTPGYNCDTFDVYYIAYGGTFQASVDGGAPVTGTGNTSTINKLTITVAAGSAHVLTLGTVTVGTCFIVGVDAYLSTAKQIRVGNAGVSGSGATHWATPSPSYSPADCIKAWAPDLTVIMLGINDAGGARTAAQYHADMLVTINAAKASGDVLLCSVVPSQDGPTNTLEVAYQSDLLAYANANGIGFLDVYARYGSYTAANTAGLMANTLHPNGPGYADIAAAAYSTLAAIA